MCARRRESHTRHNDDKGIYHVASGGTLDSVWDPARDTAVPAAEGVSIVQRYMQQRVRTVFSTESVTVCLRDSREMNLEMRDVFARQIIEPFHRRVLATSGTFLMPDIARTLTRHPASMFFDEMDRRVTFTGSLVPMRGFSLSDGGFNIGMSVAVLQGNLAERTTIVMNGSCFDANEVMKDMSVAQFTAANGKDLLDTGDLLIVPAGGSIDFEPDGLDAMVPALQSSIATFLRDTVRMNKAFHAPTMWTKDSRSITEKDRRYLLDVVADSPEKNVLIALGIYKMREIAEFLIKKLGSKKKEKKVVLTGSRFPLRQECSDAPFNLGYAIGKIPFIEPGVHITLCGKKLSQKEDPASVIFRPDEIERHKKSSNVKK